MVVGEIADHADVVVLGGGPGGYTAALRAADDGADVVLVERGGIAALGGACLHVGCIPSKALIELARGVHDTHALAPAGLVVEGARADLARFQEWRRELTARLAGGVERLLARAGVCVIAGEARFARRDRIAIRTPGDGVRFVEFGGAIVATGSRPVELRTLPFDDERVLDSTGALALTTVPTTVVVVGAGYVGIEIGTALAKLGARVTIVEALDRVLGHLDPALARPVAERLGALEIDVVLGATARHLDGGDLVVETANGERRLPADVVLVAVGRRPSTSDLGLDQAGVPVGADGLIDVGADRRAADRIAAVGDVIAGPALAHRAYADARVAVDALAGRPAAFDVRAMPQVVFSDPEVASTGLTEGEARAEGFDVAVATVPLAASGRAATLGASSGFTRVVVDRATEQVLGVHVVGPHASELITEGTLAVEMAATAYDLAATIHPHPTLSESVAEAAALATGERTSART
ncbi:MAG: dihydrolipoamide dehydrogenase [Solirubrobacteraceae bacterium]